MNIWYDILLSAIGLTPGGSSTVHIYTQTIYRTTQWNRIGKITGRKTCFFFHGSTALVGPGSSITLRHTTLGGTTLGWVIGLGDLHLITHNTQKHRHPRVGFFFFEPAIPASQRPQIHALDRAATRIGRKHKHWENPAPVSFYRPQIPKGLVWDRQYWLDSSKRGLYRLTPV